MGAPKNSLGTAFDPAAIPAELQKRDQWVAWRYVERDGKQVKVPANPRTGYEAKTNDPSTWGTFGEATRRAEADRFDGVGFVFSDADPWCGFDLDDCRNPEGGGIAAWAWEVIRLFDTYTEVSPSGAGVKGFARGALSGRGGPKPVGDRTVELYDRKRFFAVTGHHLEGTPTTVAERQNVIDELLPASRGKRGAEPLPERLEPGGREPFLFSLAGTLHQRGLGVEEILAALRAVNEERCDPPKDERELREIAEKIKERGYEPGSSGGKPTHDELARRFLDRHPGYGHGQAEWKRYGRGVWRPVPDAVVDRQILDVLVAAKQDKVQPTANLLASVNTLARVVVAVPDAEWDADPDVLVCENGALLVPTLTLREHRPDDHATSGVPYGYDPEAIAPTWGRFLGDFVDAETAHFLQEFAGYALTTDVSHELALWLFGAPGGGRSTFIAGLEAMLGEKAGTLGLGEVERSRFALADVPGRTLLTATEQPAGYMKASYVLNALISGDRLKVEEKFKPAYDVHPKAKILWAMNELPRVPSANDGLFRRVKVVEIEPVPVAERDPGVKDAIRTEGAGILNWALEGLERLRKRGGFEVPGAVKGATARWRETNDMPAMFVAEKCKINQEKSERSSDLYTNYRYWCEKNGHKPKSSTQIAEDWRRLGFERKRDKQGVLWRGVELRRENIMDSIL